MTSRKTYPPGISPTIPMGTPTLFHAGGLKPLLAQWCAQHLGGAMLALILRTLAISLIVLYTVAVGLYFHAHLTTNGVAVQLHRYGEIKYSVHHGWDHSTTRVYSSFHKDYAPHWGYAP